MTTDFLLEEQIIEERLNKYLNEFKDNTTKSKSTIVNNSNHFSFNSQGIFFILIMLIFKLMNSLEFLKLDLETEECFIELNDVSNNCQYDDYEENDKSYSVYMNRGCKKRMEDRVKF